MTKNTDFIETSVNFSLRYGFTNLDTAQYLTTFLVVLAAEPHFSALDVPPDPQAPPHRENAHRVK